MDSASRFSLHKTCLRRLPEVQDTGILPNLVIRDDVSIFPSNSLDSVEQRIASLWYGIEIRSLNIILMGSVVQRD